MEELKAHSLTRKDQQDMDYLEEMVYGNVRRPTLEDTYKMMIQK